MTILLAIFATVALVDASGTYYHARVLSSGILIFTINNFRSIGY